MGFIDIIRQIRVATGLKVAPFAAKLGVHRTSWYQWMDGIAPSPEMLTKIERTLNIRFLYDGDEIIGWEDLPVATLDDVSQMSYTVESDPHGGGSGAPSATGENRLVLMYRQDSEGTGLPQWEALSTTQKDYVRKSYLALLQNIEKEVARRRMELIKEIEADLAPDAKV